MNEEQEKKVSGMRIALTVFAKLPLPVKAAIIGGIAGIFLFLIIIISMGLILSPVVGLLTPDTSKLDTKISDAQQELRERIDRVAAQVKKDTGVDIDRALLVSTLTYNEDVDTMNDSDLVENIGETLAGEGGQNWLLTLGQSLVDKIANVTDTYLGTAFTKKGKELRRWRKSELTIYSVAIQMIKDNKVDLTYYKENLIKNIIPNFYYDQIDSRNRKASIRQIATDIFDLADMYKFWFTEEKEDEGTCNPGGTCTYTIMGESVSNIEVELINCEGKKSNYKVLATLPLEDYVMGIVKAEVDSSVHPEVIKSQAVVARTFALTRQYQMCPSNPSDCFYGYNPTTKKVRMRACEADQVYCDPKKDCYRKAEGAISKYSPEVGPENGASLWKSALSDAEYNDFVDKLNPAKGKVGLNSDGSLANVNFYNDQQEQYASLASQGYDYTEILLKVHSGGERAGLINAISEAKCSSSGSKNCGSNTGATGDFKNWKQLTSLGAPWGNIRMGKSTINNIGCLATSIAIQAANSGVTSSTFNPGNFVEICTITGVIDATGNMHQDRVSNVIPGFAHVYQKDIFGTSRQEKIQIAKQMLTDGCYPVMEVKGAGNCQGCGQHWIAVDYVTDTEIYMMDPASNETAVFAKYGNKGSSLNCYKRT